MKTFPHWRAVGRAMRWARQQDGVTIGRTSMDGHTRADGTTARLTDHKWTTGVDRGVLVSHVSTRTTVDVMTKDDDGQEWEGTYLDDARQVLRVLAALDLIPAELAEVGFRPVPWRWMAGDHIDTFPADDTPDDGDCPATYHHLDCTLMADHKGNHRAGDGTHVVAEWRDGDV